MVYLDAANDVHSALTIYARLCALAAEHDVALDDPVVSARFTAMVEIAKSVSRKSSASKKAGTKKKEKKEIAPSMQWQHLRAYQFRHERRMPMEQMRVELSLKGKVRGVEGEIGDPLQIGTVMYVVCFTRPVTLMCILGGV